MLLRGIQLTFTAWFACLSAWAGEISGTVTYRERIALPADAVLEVSVVDIARQDAPANVFASVRIENPGQVPVAFRITYDPATIDPRAVYAVRASIAVAGKLWFTTTETVRVTLDETPGAETTLILRRVSTSEGSAGVLPGPQLIAGEVSRQQSRIVLDICSEGIKSPLAPGADDGAIATALDRDGGTIFVALIGSITPAQGMMPAQTSVDRLLALLPGETCERNRTNAALMDTYWRVLALNGATVTTGEGEREANLVLKAGEAPRIAATAGCNILMGGYTLAGDQLTFGKLASTMMACPPPLAERERAMTRVLQEVRRFSISGPVMVLFGEAGETLAILQAVYLQ
jgi:uncharacterized lipoprotein YbaY/heat shock protein HslJ